jgi:starch-binding outer membrane protein, SusD/RagB family
MTMHKERTMRGRAVAGHLGVPSWSVLAAGGFFLLAGCDLGVSNPALVEEGDLETPAAVPAIVNGALGTFGLATTIQGAAGTYSASAILSGELVHSGSWTPPREISEGFPNNESPENQSHWGYSSQARWQAEDAIEKVSALVDNPGQNEWVARAQLYAGFSNRVMGEMFCDAVINGGPLEPYTTFSTRAVGYFDAAATTAQAGGHTDMRLAALAGRAQARLTLGQWDQAVADAAQVPTDFVFAHVHSDNSSSEHNGVHNWAYRGDNAWQYTVWGTPFEDWGLNTEEPGSGGDPRVTYTPMRNTAGALVIGGDNRRPIFRTDKYPERSSSIALAKGTEMRLIEAEALLRSGNVGGAVGKINDVRTFRGLTTASAGTPAEAWSLLMRERGLELYLEGRRLGDVRRWAADGQSAPHVDYEFVGRIASGQPASADPTRSVLDADPLCLRVSTDEIFSNPNLFDNPPR